ncbi:lipase family protein [Sorangium sp. So ce590]|uniref:lipase family protein n=1 Tax=Sorangium sp. So ce590 TaxID=3133317 RepID=UPI003F63A76E
MRFDDIEQDPYDVDPDEDVSISDDASVRMGREESAKSGGDHRTLDHLVSAKGGSYDPEVTSILARASTWAYSDIESFQEMMKNHGIDCECIRLTFENEALFVSPYAYLAQSRDGRLAILCFRGTRPVSLITWLMSTNVRMTPFERAGSGSVHGGFARATWALWPQLRRFLKGMLEGTPICRIFDDMTTPLQSCHPPAPVGRAAGPRRAARSRPEVAPRRALEALYITGHSLGGALAVLTAARIYTDSNIEQLRDVLRGVYTFGQPMVGNRTFARMIGKKFESKLFRHIYRKDIVPRLPPCSLGSFEHFGREYIEKNGRWMRGTETVKQVPWLVMYMVLGVTALIIDQIPNLRWIHLPVSWGDHSPWWYLRTSDKIPPGSEFEPTPAPHGD